MKRQLQGIALLLFSILLTLTFESVGWTYIGDLNLHWADIFMLTGVAGLVMVFLPDDKE